MKSTLQSKYKEVPERVIVIALESVDYDESKATKILDIMVKEESNSSKNSKESTSCKEDERYCIYLHVLDASVFVMLKS